MMEKLFEKISGVNVNHPQFEEAGRVHDWRNHVPSDIIEVWVELTERERKLMAVFAEKLAEAEEWD